MTRPRDSQRSKLYEAERMIYGGFGEDSRKRDLGEVRAYYDRVTGSRFFRVLWFEVRGKRLAEKPANILLKDGRGTSWARGGFRYYDRVVCEECNCPTKSVPNLIINMPRWARQEVVMLHELAHCVVGRDKAAHGPEFASVMLKLVKRFMGREAYSALKKSYRTHRVKWITRGKGRKLKPEQRAAAIERLAAARKARR